MKELKNKFLEICNELSSTVRNECVILLFKLIMLKTILGYSACYDPFSSIINMQKITQPVHLKSPTNYIDISIKDMREYGEIIKTMIKNVFTCSDVELSNFKYEMSYDYNLEKYILYNVDISTLMYK